MSEYRNLVEKIINKMGFLILTLTPAYLVLSGYLTKENFIYIYFFLLLKFKFLDNESHTACHTILYRFIITI